MSQPIKITEDVSNRALNAGIGDEADSGILRIYDGTEPATAETAITDQNLLAEFTLDAAAFPPASGGEITAAAIAPVAAGADGIASWFRLFDAAGTTVLLQGSVGTAAAALILNSVNLVETGEVTISSLIFRGPLACA